MTNTSHTHCTVNPCKLTVFNQLLAEAPLNSSTPCTAGPTAQQGLTIQTDQEIPNSRCAS